MYKPRKTLLLIILYLQAGFAYTQDKPEDLLAFLPSGYIIREKIVGDLNNDGLKDCVLLIKSTDSSQCITDEMRGKLDMNRRGLIILFNKKGHYELAAKNLNFLLSENEDGGNYFAPELIISIRKSNIYFNYLHGRYGNWKYTFRFVQNEFVLAGYDNSDNHGPYVIRKVSINFLTHRKWIKESKNSLDPENAEGYTITWESLKHAPLLKLTAIADLDEIGPTFL